MPTPRLEDHYTELAVFLVLIGVVLALGFLAARWRRPVNMYNLDEWGLGGRSFGPVLTWFLVGGDIYTAYTFIALPALLYGVGAFGFFAVPFATLMYPLVFIALTRMWSVAHVHGLVTPADFVRVRFGSKVLASLVAVCSIVATMPYIALQLLGMEAVFKVVGLNGSWPLWAAFAIVSVFTYNAGLRAPALISILKDILILWIVLAALVIVGSTGGWGKVFTAAEMKFDSTASTTDGILLAPTQYLNFTTAVLGSALALFLYPHVVTGVLAAKNRAAVRRNIAGLPIYTLMLGFITLLGYLAIAQNIVPVGADPAAGLPGDRNTIMPKLFDISFPDWVAGTAFAAIVIGAFVPAAIMSIAAANLFTRNIYKEYIRPGATPAEETRVSKFASLTVKFGAVMCIVGLDPQFSLDLQLIGGVVILQILPAVGLGLYSAWLHRHALIAGMLTGLTTGIVMLYNIPRPGKPDTHFGGSAFPLDTFGITGGHTVYVGLVAVALNLGVAVVTTPLLRLFRVRDGRDITWRRDYLADEGDPDVRRLDELLDGRPVDLSLTEVAAKHAEDSAGRSLVRVTPRDIPLRPSQTRQQSPSVSWPPPTLGALGESVHDHRPHVPHDGWQNAHDGRVYRSNGWWPGTGEERRQDLWPAKNGREDPNDEKHRYT